MYVNKQIPALSALLMPYTILISTMQSHYYDHDSFKVWLHTHTHTHVSHQVVASCRVLDIMMCVLSACESLGHITKYMYMQFNPCDVTVCIVNTRDDLIEDDIV